MPGLRDIGETGPPPRDELIRRRWLPQSKVRQAREASAIMVQYGSVYGSAVYDKREHARWRARYLIGLFTDLHMFDRWELREHVERVDGGFIWAVEYLGRRKD